MISDLWHARHERHAVQTAEAGKELPKRRLGHMHDKGNSRHIYYTHAAIVKMFFFPFLFSFYGLQKSFRCEHVNVLFRRHRSASAWWSGSASAVRLSIESLHTPYVQYNFLFYILGFSVLFYDMFNQCSTHLSLDLTMDYALLRWFSCQEHLSMCVWSCGHHRTCML